MFIYKPAGKHDQLRLSVCAGGTVMFGAFTIIFLMLFTEPDWLLIASLLTGGSLLLFLVFLFFLILTRKQYSLRYLFLGEEYERQRAEVLPHFASADEAYKKQLEKDCKRTYRVLGRVLSFGTYKDATLSRNAEQVAVLRAMLARLIACSDDGSGWEGFLRSCDDGAYSYRRRTEEGYTTDSLDGWEIRSLLTNAVFSDAWRYLVHTVADLCDFTLKDTRVSEEYTENLKRSKEYLARCHSPILFTFRAELEELASRLDTVCAK